MVELGGKVVYQIYPKSFQDTDGDGWGDLRGIIKRLDYLKDLGVDYLWITPFFTSPQNDNGYDIEDYRNIDPRYGTMEDFEELVREAAKRDMYLMMDMVLNHTSTRHQWFQKALKGDPKYRDYNILKQQGKSEEEVLRILGAKSRDNSRTPMQWDSSENAGFTTGTPWLKVCDRYQEINKESKNDPNSIFQYYKKLVSLRKELPVIQKGSVLPILREDKEILAYKREYEGKELYVFCNFFDRDAKVKYDIPKDCKCILSNYGKDVKPEDLKLRPYEAVMFLR